VSWLTSSECAAGGGEDLWIEGDDDDDDDDKRPCELSETDQYIMD